MSLSGVDYAVIGLYFGLVFAVALLPGLKGGAASSEKASEEYFLSGRSLSWFLVGASLFASNIGSEHLVGLAGSGAASGLPVAQYEILAGLVLLLLGWFFAPYYLATGVSTMPEFLERRYGPAAKYYLSIVSVIAYVLTKISVTIFAGATVFAALGVPFWVGAVLVVALTGFYTVMGGLRAVIYTDAVQMVVMIGGSALVLFFGLRAVGGIEGLTQAVEPEFFSLWRPSNHPDFPWTGILTGAPILGVWYWCTDQFVVQRVLSAKNLKEARRGAIFGGFLKQLPLFIFVIPGIIAMVLAQQGSLDLQSPDQALPTLISVVLPTGLRGLVLAGLLAALMSSLSSVFNSCSTLLTYDLFRPFFPSSSDAKLVRIGQLFSVLMVIIGLLWIPMMRFVSEQLFIYIQTVQSYLAPPIAALFLVGLLSNRPNLRSAMLSVAAGVLLTIIRLIGQSWDQFGFIGSMNFLHFAAMLFVVCAAILMIFGNTQSEDNTLGVGPTALHAETDRLSRTLSIALLGLIALIWWWFR